MKKPGGRISFVGSLSPSALRRISVRVVLLDEIDGYVSTKEGDQIKKGHTIATMGDGPERKPRLHFEVRRNGEPVDPRRYLPAS